MIDFLKRLIGRYGFFRRTVQIGFLPGSDNWHDANFYTETTRASYNEFMREVKADAKNQRLAQIARERCALKEQLAKAIRDKKARAPIYQALRALSVEELRVETGK